MCFTSLNELRTLRNTLPHSEIHTCKNVSVETECMNTFSCSRIACCRFGLGRCYRTALGCLKMHSVSSHSHSSGKFKSSLHNKVMWLYWAENWKNLFENDRNTLILKAPTLVWNVVRLPFIVAKYSLLACELLDFSCYQRSCMRFFCRQGQQGELTLALTSLVPQVFPPSMDWQPVQGVFQPLAWWLLG